MYFNFQFPGNPILENYSYFLFKEHIKKQNLRKMYMSLKPALLLQN